MSKFYVFDQNNSGGSFIVDDNVCGYVIIEADSARDANYRAENVGIYFNGCDTGQDCDCCGDRWSDQWNDDDGYDVPSIYGTPVEEVKKGIFRTQCIIHYMDGRRESVHFEG